MTLTIEERCLLNLYYSGSVDDTANTIRDALADITEPDVRAAAESVLQKLEDIGGTEFDCLAPESELNTTFLTVSLL